MKRPKISTQAQIDKWRTQHPLWSQKSKALSRTFAFPDFAQALAFAVRVGCLAERADHHPDLGVSWGKVSVLWTTHDAGGITALDLELASHCEEAAL